MVCPLATRWARCDRWWCGRWRPGPHSELSATVESEAIPTAENEATQQSGATPEIGWVISVEGWALIRRLVAD